MYRLVSLVLLIAFAAFISSVRAQDTVRATADMQDASGQSLGTLTLTQQAGAVHITGTLHNLPPGDHGLHIHAVGTCSPDFSAAGGHFNPEGSQHGLNNPAGPHAGDLENLTVSQDGTATYDYQNDRVTLGSGSNALFDADGSALIVHAGPDDHATDPTGNSGDRIACGVLQPAQETGQPAELPATGSPAGLPWLSMLVITVFALGGGWVLLRRSRWHI